MTTSNITVHANGTLEFDGKTYRCALGKKGISPDKKEGDNCTPSGTFALRECWYRADKGPVPDTLLPVRPITPADGWCDDAAHALYNKHFIIPASAGDPTSQDNAPDMPRSYERLWRDDDVYDLIVPLGYNDAPIIPGKGSAIFMHLARPKYEGTEGCVALNKDDLLEILAKVKKTTKMVV